ncbi:MAG: DUF58 domain-containing protein [Kineosporiaceae bacterium]
MPAPSPGRPAAPAAGRWGLAGLSALTTRGRSFLAAGLTAFVCALVLDQRDLLRVGVLLAVVPLGALLTTSRYRYRLALKRTIAPARVVAGTTARVSLELENLTRVPTRVLLAEDRVPYALGPSPRFVIARLPGRRRAAVTYSLRSEIRGRYALGPLRLRLTDAFGMCEVTRSFTGTDRLVVVPKVFPLGGVQGSGQWAGTGDSLTRNAAAAGEDDVAIREYRYGDDLRRVHWRSTAHRGELMVRRDEQPRQMRATVILDTRAVGHRGDGPASSFEWAVSAAASVAIHLAGQRYGLRLLLDDTPSGWTTAGAGDDTAGTVLDDLAVVRLGGPGDLADAVTTLTRTGGDGMVVAVLGEAGTDEVTALATLGRHGARGVAILLRTPEWGSGVPERRVEKLAEARRHHAEILRTAGWSVAEAGAGDGVAEVWARATEGGVSVVRPRMVVLPRGGDR